MEKRYNFEHAATQLITAVGFMTIAAALFLAFFIGNNAPVGMGYLGAVVFISGCIQGLLLIGVGSVGTAILDGSATQQDMLAFLRGQLDKPDNAKETNELLLRYLVASSLGAAGSKFIEIYKGELIVEVKSGGYGVGEKLYTDLTTAQNAIEKDQRMTTVKENLQFDLDGAVMFMGYRVPVRDGKFLFEGKYYENGEMVADLLLEDLNAGRGWNLGRYKIKQT